MQQVEIYVKTSKGTKSIVGASDFGYDGVDFHYWAEFYDVLLLSQGQVSVGDVFINETTGEQATIDVITEYGGGTYIEVSNDVFNSTDTYVFNVSENYADKEYVRLDLFSDETIEVTENIKDFKDVSKVLTDYTNQFSVPSSNTNNKVFRHYYNQDIVNGFDARFRADSIIKLNGIDWKKGQIRLTNVGLKDALPEEYELTFFGNIVSLNSILGDDELNALPYLDAFNHELSLTLVSRYASLGADLVYDVDGNPTGITTSSSDNPDLIYPFISASSRYYYDSTDGSQQNIENVRNVAIQSPSVIDEYHNVKYTDLKPAIKAINIIRAIESRYGLSFSDDFIDEDNDFFKSLYVWMSRESGSLNAKIEEEEVDIDMFDLSLDSGDEVREGADLDQVSTYSGVTGGRRTNYREFYYTCSIDVVGGGLWGFEVLDKETGQLYVQRENITGNYDFFFSMSSNIRKTYKPIIKIKTKGGITSVSFSDVKIEQITADFVTAVVTGTGNYSDIASSSLSNGLDIRNSMTPKIKCIDFIKSIFKMGNLLAYEEDGVIVVKTYNEFYKDGNVVDISPYIDSSGYKISRSDIYSEINYEFKEPKSVFTIKSNEATNDEYGKERFKSDETTSFDGGKYDVKVDFGHSLGESFVNLSNDVSLAMSWLYSVSDSFSPVNEDCLLFCADSRVYTLARCTDDVSLGARVTIISPMNIYYNRDKGRWDSINFGEELASFVPATPTNVKYPIKNSLFYNFHKEQILNIYNAQSRLLKVKAVIPLSVKQFLKMNDTVIVKSKEYIINSLKTNLETNESELVLISKTIPFDNELEDNQFIGIDNQGLQKVFSSYANYAYQSSSASACASSILVDFSAIAISEDGYAYKYVGSDLVLQNLGSVFYVKLVDYTHDVIEIDANGLITDKIDC